MRNSIMTCNIIWLESVDSTNSEIRRRIENLDDLTVISARNQTEGRGQNGNKWFSQHGQSLTFSIVLKQIALRAWEQAAISEAVALAIVDTLDSYGIKAWIKWPNDIYCGDKKICGILIENSLMGEQIRWSIIGIGLNVNQTNFPTDLPNPTSMKLCTGCEYQIEDILVSLTSRITKSYNDFLQSPGHEPELRERYLCRSGFDNR